PMVQCCWRYIVMITRRCFNALAAVSALAFKRSHAPSLARRGAAERAHPVRRPPRRQLKRSRPVMSSAPASGSLAPSPGAEGASMERARSLLDMSKLLSMLSAHQRADHPNPAEAQWRWRGERREPGRLNVRDHHAC